MRREIKSLRNGVHHANGVVREPVYGTHLSEEGRSARANDLIGRRRAVPCDFLGRTERTDRAFGDARVVSPPGWGWGMGLGGEKALQYCIISGCKRGRESILSFRSFAKSTFL
jgi:hypothetical protein